MLVYYDPETGDIQYTLQLKGERDPPRGSFIMVEGEIDPLRQKVAGGRLVGRDAPSPELRRAAQEKIATARGRVRADYITDLPGQDMVYLEKRSEAVAYLAHPAPEAALFPMVWAEVGITAATPWEVAQIWLNMSDIWRAVSTRVEAITLKATRLVEEASTTSALDEALSAMEAELAQLS